MATAQNGNETPAQSEPSKAAASLDPSQGKCFIGGISWDTTQEGLRYHFEKYGKLSDVVLMRDRYTGQPRGFGFVTYEDPSVIDKVLAETHTLDNKTVEVKKAVPRDRAPPPVSAARSPRGGPSMDSIPVKKIFVGGLAPSVTEPEFRAYFEKYGKVVDAVVMYDRETQRSRGFGFITFDEEEAVTRSLAEQHELNGKGVEVKKAVPRESRPPPRGGPPRRSYGMSQGGGDFDGRGGGYGYGGSAPPSYGYGRSYGYGGGAPAYGGGYPPAGPSYGGYGYGGMRGGPPPGGEYGGGRPSYGYGSSAGSSGMAGYGNSAGSSGGMAGYGSYPVAGGRDVGSGGFGPSRSSRGTERYRPY